MYMLNSRGTTKEITLKIAKTGVPIVVMVCDWFIKISAAAPCFLMIHWLREICCPVLRTPWAAYGEDSLARKWGLQPAPCWQWLHARLWARNTLSTTPKFLTYEVINAFSFKLLRFFFGGGEVICYSAIAIQNKEGKSNLKLTKNVPAWCMFPPAQAQGVASLSPAIKGCVIKPPLDQEISLLWLGLDIS